MQTRVWEHVIPKLHKNDWSCVIIGHVSSLFLVSGLQMTAFLKSEGMTEAVLSVFRGIGAAAGVAATFTFPLMASSIGEHQAFILAILAVQNVTVCHMFAVPDTVWVCTTVHPTLAREQAPIPIFVWNRWSLLAELGV